MNSKKARLQHSTTQQRCVVNDGLLCVHVSLTQSLDAMT